MSEDKIKELIKEATDTLLNEKAIASIILFRCKTELQKYDNEISKDICEMIDRYFEVAYRSENNGKEDGEKF